MPEIPIQILLVEDDSEDLVRIADEIEEKLGELSIPAVIHRCGDFDEAKRLATDPSRHFDLIISDTYKGPTINRDAEVIGLITEYRKGKFTPLIVMSSGVKPDAVVVGPFLIWAGKTPTNELPDAVATIMATGIPQLSRRLHAELNSSAGTYLWTFLEQNWAPISARPENLALIVERLIRRRAATMIADTVYTDDGHSPIEEVAGLEYYIYPPLQKKGFMLGSVVRSKSDPADFRVILTPHCHLTLQVNQTKPRAELVLTIGAVPARNLISSEKLEKVKNAVDKGQRDKRLKVLVSAQDLGLPEGRFWFLPSFLDIPYLYCDFMRVQSVPYENLVSDFDSVATLSPPFAESLQSSFVAYYASVGTANLDLDSISSITD